MVRSETVHWSYERANGYSPRQVAYQRILQLTYVDELLAALKALFIKLFQPFLTTFVASLRATSSSGPLKAPKGSGSKTTDTAVSWDFARAFEKWDGYFDQLLKEIESRVAQVCPPRFCLSQRLSDEVDKLPRTVSHVSSSRPMSRCQSSPARPLTTRAPVRCEHVCL